MVEASQVVPAKGFSWDAQKSFLVNSDGTGVTSSNPLPVSSNSIERDSIENGQSTVTTAGTAEQLTSTAKSGYITIARLSSNTGDIYVGDSSVDSSNGFVLDDNITNVTLEVSDLSSIYIDSSVNGAGVSFIAGYTN